MNLSLVNIILLDAPGFYHIAFVVIADVFYLHHGFPFEKKLGAEYRPGAYLRGRLIRQPFITLAWISKRACFSLRPWFSLLHFRLFSHETKRPLSGRAVKSKV
jgi:hypothetical protein